MTIKSRRDIQQRMERSDPGGKKGSLQGDGACLDLTQERGDITAEAGISGGPDHAAGTGRRSPDLVQVQDPNTVTTAEVVAKAGSGRRGLRKCTERV